MMVYSKRFERKYIINFETYKEIKNYIKKFFKPDENGDNGRYIVSSLYYDSSDFRFYREKIDGEKKRSKVRLRVYYDLKGNYLSPTKNKVLLEIKKRNNLNIFKKKVILKEKEAKKFIETPVLDKKLLNKYDKKEKLALTEAAYLKTLYDIKPVVIVTYIREAFMNKFGPEVRITFDRNIKYRENNFDVRDISCKNHILDSRLIIMEIKYNEILPVWISELISKHGLALNTFGKYSTSIDKMMEKREEFIKRVGYQNT